MCGRTFDWCLNCRVVHCPQLPPSKRNWTCSTRLINERRASILTHGDHFVQLALCHLLDQTLFLFHHIDRHLHEDHPLYVCEVLTVDIRLHCFWTQKPLVVSVCATNSHGWSSTSTAQKYLKVEALSC